MQISRSLVIVFFVLSVAVSPVTYADISIVGKPSSTTGGVISGPITAKDAIRVSELQKRGVLLKIVRLNSMGGDVNAAMTIGRILRKNGAVVLVEQDDICASACVFIAAAGVIRSIKGQIFIHRPYSMATETAGLDLAAWDKRMKALRKQVDTYLSEMNVSVGLADAMWAISPEDSRLISNAELEQFLLGNADASYDDYSATQDANTYGLTKPETLRRLKLVSQTCGKFAVAPITKEKIDGYSRCKESVMRN